MYLVELRPGKEELYRSVDELAAAIRCGDVDVHSRIFHRATSKWISITLHPQFKAIAAAKESEPLPPMPQKQWTFLTSAAEELESAAGSAAEPGAALDASLPATTAEPGSNENGGRWRRSAALGLAWLLLILGVQVAFSVPRPQWPRFASRATEAKPEPRRLAAPKPAVHAGASAAGSSVVSLAGTAAWDQVGYPLPTDAGAPGKAPKRIATVPAAPAVRLQAVEDAVGAVASDTESSDTEARNDVPAAEILIERYNAAYDEAWARLRTVLPVVRLEQLFTPAHLASADSVRALRSNIAGAVNFVRAYRRREIEIERTYQDTFAVLSRQLDWPSKQVLRWYGRPSRKESSAAVALTGALLASADSVLALLSANSNGYRLTDASVVFDRPETAAEYARLRRQFEGQLDSARAAQSDVSSGALATLLDALGAVRLPVEKSSS